MAWACAAATSISSRRAPPRLPASGRLAARISSTTSSRCFSNRRSRAAFRRSCWRPMPRCRPAAPPSCRAGALFVITSSTAATDLGAICRAVLGCDVVSSQPLGAGGNSRVFRVDLDQRSPSQPACVVVKFYRRDRGDARDRLGTEFGSLQFLWQNGVRSIPRPLAIVRDRQCAIYECLEGEVAASGAIGPADVDAAIDFLCVLKRLRRAPGSDTLAPASEACFSLRDVVSSVEARLRRLHDAGAGEDACAMRTWIAGTVVPLAEQVGQWCRRAAAAAEIDFDEPIGAEARTLSPSDF